MIYSAIEQMRPSAILESIHDHTLAGTRAPTRPCCGGPGARPGTGPPRCTVRAASDGFIAAIDLDRPRGGAAAARGPRWPCTCRSAPMRRLATRSPRCGRRRGRLAALADAVERAVRLERERDLERDPAFGLEQIETIAWTTISTSKQDPIRDWKRSATCAICWRAGLWPTRRKTEAQVDARLAIVYPDDVLERLMGTIESLTVVASESMQHQVYADILRGLAITLDRLPPPLARRTEEVVLRSLAGLGDQILTAELDAHSAPWPTPSIRRGCRGRGRGARRPRRTGHQCRATQFARDAGSDGLRRGPTQRHLLSHCDTT